MGNNRSSLFHPPLKTGGGTTLWNHIDTIYQILSDNDVGRWVTFTALANSGVKTITHGFGVAFDDLTVLVYTGAYPNMTQSTAFTVTANAANPKTKIDITAPSSGGPFTGAVLVLHTAAWQQRVVTTAQRTALVSPKPGSFVYDSDVGSLFVYKDSAWVSLADVSSAQTLTNKTISGQTNTITNVSLTTGVTEVLPASKGGTGVSNADAATLTRSGDHGLTLTTTDPTAVTLPTTGTLSTLAGAEVFTNKDNDGGTASNTSRLTLPKASKTILDGLTRKQATLVYGEDTNKVYADDGSTLKEIGSGSSGINYLSAQFAADALGTVELSVGDTLATTTRTSPTRWGSSATTALIAQSTNSTLRGTTNYLVSFSANAQFVESPLFTIDGSDLAKPLTVSFDVSGVATADDVQVYVARYNTSNVLQERTVIAGTASATSPNSAQVPTATTSFRGFFIPSATATDKYAIRWRRNANNTSLRLDSLFVGPQSLAQGAVVTNPINYVPNNTQGFGTLASSNVQWRRVGGFMHISGRFVTGTVTASQAQFSIPGGHTIGQFAGQSGIQVVGTWATSLGALNSGKFGQVLATPGTNYFNFSLGDYSLNYNPLTPQAGNGIVTSATLTEFTSEVVIPIAEWSSGTTTLADRAVEEYASNSNATTSLNTSDITSFAYGLTGSLIPNASTGGNTVRRVRFQTPILPTDKIILEFLESPSAVTWQDAASQFPQTAANTGRYGAVVSNISSTDVDVYFLGSGYFQTGATYGASGATWASLFTNGARWRLRKVSGGAAVGYPVSARNIVGDTSGTVVPIAMIGEQISANGDVSASTSSQTIIATATLTAGTWLVSATDNSNGSSTQTGANIYLYSKGLNTATAGVDLLYMRYASGNATAVTFASRVINVAPTDSDKTVLIKVQAITAGASHSAHIVAIRIA